MKKKEIGITESTKEIGITESVPEKKYKVGRWHESPNYECTLCPFSTLSKERMEEHITEVHSPPPSPWSMTKLPKFDRFGNLIEEKE